MRVRDDDVWLLLDEDGELALHSRQHKVRKGRKPARSRSEIQAMLAEERGQEESKFEFTYKAGRHEEQWITSALASFYADHLITDVVRIVRGGKEATVYCCTGHPATGLDLLAAKIYRPRLLRNLKNDALYKEGRAFLGDDGKTMQDRRSLLAIRKKTRVGSAMTITSWIEHEFQTLRTLHQAGAIVPKPVAQQGNAILMEYIGEVGNPAPTLNNVKLERSEARPLFELLMHNIEMMLAHQRVHADLSAYNVLYWEGNLTIIDFPQVIDPLLNPQGDKLLARDVERICQYFHPYGIAANPYQIATGLWGSYLRGELQMR